MTGHLLLIDSSGFAYRSFYGAPPRNRESDGQPTGAVQGFMTMIWALLVRAEADPPTHAAAVFDAPGPTFRHKLFPEYKANRALARARQFELGPQLIQMRHAAEAFGLTPVEASGWEADDVIATLATRATEADIRTTIVSSDKDFCQLVRNDMVEIIDPMSRKRAVEADVAKKFGVPPSLVVDVQALCGDTVDNIPGVPGIGMEKAAGLIRRFGSLSKLLKDIDKGRGYLTTPAIHAALRRERKNIPLYKKLATLQCDVPLDVELDTLAVKPVQRRHIDAILTTIEAGPALRAVFSPERTLFRIVPGLKPGADPLAWHTAALKKGAKRGTIPDLPQCGWYKRHLVKGGCWVAGRIWRDPESDFATGKRTGRDILMCMVGGERRDVLSEWMKLCTQPIKEEDYSHMIAVAKWAKQHSPSSCEAVPTKAIDWNAIDL